MSMSMLDVHVSMLHVPLHGHGRRRIDTDIGMDTYTFMATDMGTYMDTDMAIDTDLDTDMDMDIDMDPDTGHGHGHWNKDNKPL